MAAKLWRDYTLVMHSRHDSILYYATEEIANTPYRIRNFMSARIHKNHEMWEWWSPRLWEHDERYRKKVFERCLKERPSSFKWDETLWIPSPSKLFKSVNFNSDAFRHERSQYHELEQQLTIRDAIAYWEKKEQELANF